MVYTFGDKKISEQEANRIIVEQIKCNNTEEEIQLYLEGKGTINIQIDEKILVKGAEHRRIVKEGR